MLGPIPMSGGKWIADGIIDVDGHKCAHYLSTHSNSEPCLHKITLNHLFGNTITVTCKDLASAKRRIADEISTIILSHDPLKGSENNFK